jgi:hypothetical protein
VLPSTARRVAPDASLRHPISRRQPADASVHARALHGHPRNVAARNYGLRDVPKAMQHRHADRACSTSGGPDRRRLRHAQPAHSRAPRCDRRARSRIARDDTTRRHIPRASRAEGRRSRQPA